MKVGVLCGRLVLCKGDYWDVICCSVRGYV